MADHLYSASAQPHSADFYAPTGTHSTMPAKSLRSAEESNTKLHESKLSSFCVAAAHMHPLSPRLDVRAYLITLRYSLIPRIWARTTLLKDGEHCRKFDFNSLETKNERRGRVCYRSGKRCPSCGLREYLPPADLLSICFRL